MVLATPPPLVLLKAGKERQYHCVGEGRLHDSTPIWPFGRLEASTEGDSDMDLFSIESLQPIGGNLWLAEIVVKTEETVDDREVAQVARLKVRFTFDPSAPVEALLQRAVDEARRCLALSSAYLQDRALPELMAEMDYVEPVFDPGPS